MTVSDFMHEAIFQAAKAREINEVPIGAVITKNGTIISVAHNERDKNKQATDHAEILAIKRACKSLGGWRLTECDIFVTLEPCPMCAGAIIEARIKNVYFGCYDKKTGAFGGFADFSTFKWPHKPNVYGGILEKQCGSLLTDFFGDVRESAFVIDKNCKR